MAMFRLEICKKILFLSIFLFYQNLIFCQSIFNASIQIDSTVDPKKITVSYYDGKKLIKIDNNFYNNTMSVKKEYYSEKACVTIFYFDSIFYAYDFFVDTLPSFINLTYNKNLKPEIRFAYTKLINTASVMDSSNQIYNKISKANLVHLKELRKFVNNNRQLLKNANSGDSVYINSLNLFKKKNNIDISILKGYPNDYFSFWYFQHQILIPAILDFNKSKIYIESLLDTMKLIFPARFLNSVEGESIMNTVNSYLYHHPILNEECPDFSFQDNNKNMIKYKNLKGKYILLNFWATWCKPCIDEIPFLKSLQDIGKNKLILISICESRDQNKFRKIITQNKMNWIHYFDSENYMINKFNVTEYPTSILVDIKGKVIFRSYINGLDNNKLHQLIKKR